MKNQPYCWVMIIENHTAGRSCNDNAELNVPAELSFASGVARRPPAQIRRPLTNCEVESLDKRRVQSRRVLGVIEGLIESPRCANQRSSFDLHDTIIPARLEDLAIETSRPKDSTDNLLVEIESVGDDQGKFREIHSLRDFADERQSVQVASSPDDGRRPETRLRSPLKSTLAATCYQ